MGVIPEILVKHILSVPVGFLKWEVQGISKNPCDGIKKFEENNVQERYLTPEELERLCVAIRESENPLLEPIILMLILTGARKSEILNARWEDVDLQRKSIRFPFTKSGKPRTVPLSDSAVGVLEGLERTGLYVFPNPDTGKPFTSVYRSWFTAREKACLEDVKLHTLRHSFASFLINAGRSIYEVGALLGHSKIETTMRYAHLAEETLKEAVNSVPLGKAA